ncbi:MAG: hypothetical protein LWX83_08180 [Anaerolineae bacterium]|nr:hypothetical protein [Anaerolineae bacterium]
MKLSAHAALPLKNSPRLIYSGSLLIVLLMSGVSAAGLLYREQVYPDKTLLNAFLPNDAVNLLLGLPVLLTCLILSRRGCQAALLGWAGVLLFVLYNYISYLFALPPGPLFLFHLALVMLSLYNLMQLLLKTDIDLLAARLTHVLPEKLIGGVLAALGLLFFARAFAMLSLALTGSGTLNPAELGVNMADILITPAWVIGGVQSWRRQAWGLAAAPALLFQAALLFLALVLFLLLQPWLTGLPFAAVDAGVVAVMGLVCWVPCGLMLRKLLPC